MSNINNMFVFSDHAVHYYIEFQLKQNVVCDDDRFDYQNRYNSWMMTLKVLLFIQIRNGIISIFNM